jgi:transcriptional regulator with PAS, ATPase and Fis domain
VRIIASTKCDLLERIARGGFRQDLYYRLDVLRVNVPPLRERLEDVPLLAERFLQRLAHGAPYRLDPCAAELLVRHHWPGNVRELLHTLERAYLVGGGELTADLLAVELASVSQQRPDAQGFQATIQQTERELLEKAMDAAKGN